MQFYERVVFPRTLGRRWCGWKEEKCDDNKDREISQMPPNSNEEVLANQEAENCKKQ